MGECAGRWPYDDDDDDEPYDEDGVTRRLSCGGGGGGGAGHAWSRVVAAAGRSIQAPPSQAERGANSLAAVRVPRVGFWGGLRRLAGIVFWDVVHPGSVARTAWDMFMVVLLVYVAVVTPYVIGFDIVYDDLSSFLGLAELVLNGFFLLDIFLNFRTAVLPGGDPANRSRLITRRAAIARSYLAGWFALDLMAGLPWNQVRSPFSAPRPRSPIRLELLPAGLADATCLTRLDVADCNLQSLEGLELTRLTGLRQLILSGNWRLGYCPDAVVSLGLVTQLDLSGCGLSGLPASLGYATQLLQLQLSSNDLQQVPDCLSRLTLLRSLHLDYNGLQRLPACLAALTALTALDVGGNALGALPGELGALGALQHLALGSNALEEVAFLAPAAPTNPLPRLTSYGRLAVRQYLAGPSGGSGDGGGGGNYRILADAAAARDDAGSSSAAAAALDGRGAAAGSGGGRDGGDGSEDGSAGARRSISGRDGVSSHAPAAAAAAAAAAGGGGGGGLQAEAEWGDAAYELYAGSYLQPPPPPPSPPPPRRKGSGGGGAGAGVEAAPGAASQPPFAMASGVAAAQAAEAAALPPRRQWRMLYSDSVPFKHVRTLKPNSFFGEYGCLTGCPRTASVVARRASELYVLVRADLAAALGGWADLRAVWQVRKG
ncbi:Protein LAP2 [Tetrabaena socialis]|uniref:Protein LAP2 n=1 Tax=Tetrabaena socialis TaxID=47790 RepID=A0A2J7ZV11_9CHLO|nr:Protein LAP2 [Tetrabaena socialis]|eukprot:PNH04113.1 Protein LAP2 [Tetrabaena socialis]